MIWKPTEGAKRAGDVVCDLDRDAKANGWPIHYLILVRMQDVIAHALDQALADGAEKGALEKTTEPWGDFEHAGAFASAPTLTTTATIPYKNGNGNGHANPDDYSELPVTTKAEIYMTELDTLASMEVVMNPGVIAEYPPSEVLTPKKRRGRPPGAKGKKAKVKVAKAKKEAAPVVVPDPTGTADLVVAPETPVNAAMTNDRLAAIHAELRLMPITWALRWCDRKGECACKGCAGNLLSQKGFTRDEWREWWDVQIGTIESRHPAFPVAETVAATVTEQREAPA